MEKELRTNAVTLSPQAQYDLRRSMVRLSKQGKTPDEIARILDVGRSTVYKTLKAYREEGIKGIRPKKRGRVKGENHVLTPEQEKEVQQIIVEKNPEQMKLKCCLWTRKAIHDLILQKYRINIVYSTLGYYLERWGFSIIRAHLEKTKNPKSLENTSFFAFEDSLSVRQRNGSLLLAFWLCIKLFGHFVRFSVIC